ncbi:C-C motif chemokine 4-like isoform X1 [Centroberyx affinis]|uniref:C-C motif chemokine 4-like isoform X1 n=1 Tax=Centroberyx affinis TaxID=166261 RepID=UPI003A5BC108
MDSALYRERPLFYGHSEITSKGRRASSGHIDEIMKTLCLGLLLLTVYCCNALPKGLRFSTSPGPCCFRFSTHRLPANMVSITKTHGACRTPAFIVHTSRGNQICYSQTFQLAADAYKKLHQTKASGRHA